MKKHFFKTNIKSCYKFNCIFRKQSRLAVVLTFFKMMKYLCLNFLLHKYSKASLNSSLYKSKTVTFIETDSDDIENRRKYMHLVIALTNFRVNL